MDFEDNNQRGTPGLRIVIRGEQYIGYKMTAGRKPGLRRNRVPVPRERWFELKVNLRLDPTHGRVTIWRDGEPVIDGAATPLPDRASLLNSSEIGMTATAMDTVPLVDQAPWPYIRATWAGKAHR